MYENFGLLVDGQWRKAADGGALDVFSPVTEERVGVVPAAGQSDIGAALAAAAEGFRTWSAVPAWSRAAVLRRAADLLRQRIEEAACLMSTETGKPLAEARAETGAAADQFEWYGEEAKRIYGQTIPGRARDE